ncbi:glycosyltransferase family 2 protein [Paenibacillus silvisoli]|uniref:glycosyltransferase family 2 protein n=1 Tax=Paenibacillus silvisoli TaxID=3110539 RepID=UPI0028061B37|nr:glycosyltransferase family 2 protein [Paenibacillus silvisoli]
MITISLCMIVKDEEQNLARCLDSVHDLVDELIIVDTGSSDGTKAIAAKYTRLLFDFAWVDDFAAARNYSFGFASCDYIMWLDADDILFEKDRMKLRELKFALNPDSAPEAITMDYHLAFAEDGTPLSATRRNRLVKQSAGCRWHSPIHEFLDVTGYSAAHADIAVSHFRSGDHTKRNMRMFEKWIADGLKLEGRMLYHYANELADHKRCEEAIAQFEAFLMESRGYADDRITACRRLAECCRFLDRKDEELRYLLRSFEYGAPLPDICCVIGSSFEEKGDLATASYWYHRALDDREAAGYMGVSTFAARTWLPHARLCICYASRGDLKKACFHNEQALTFCPDDAALQNNKRKLITALGISEATN